MQLHEETFEKSYEEALNFWRPLYQIVYKFKK